MNVSGSVSPQDFFSEHKEVDLKVGIPTDRTEQPYKIGYVSRERIDEKGFIELIENEDYLEDIDFSRKDDSDTFRKLKKILVVPFRLKGEEEEIEIAPHFEDAEKLLDKKILLRRKDKPDREFTAKRIKITPLSDEQHKLVCTVAFRALREKSELQKKFDEKKLSKTSMRTRNIYAGSSKDKNIINKTLWKKFQEWIKSFYERKRFLQEQIKEEEGSIEKAWNRKRRGEEKDEFIQSKKLGRRMIEENKERVKKGAGKKHGQRN